jgi:hypothetical protein
MTTKKKRKRIPFVATGGVSDAAIMRGLYADRILMAEMRTEREMGPRSMQERWEERERERLVRDEAEQRRLYEAQRIVLPVSMPSAFSAMQREVERFSQEAYLRERGTQNQLSNIFAALDGMKERLETLTMAMKNLREDIEQRTLKPTSGGPGRRQRTYRAE